jgi:hypothetical protein
MGCMFCMAPPSSDFLYCDSCIIRICKLCIKARALTCATCKKAVLCETCVGCPHYTPFNCRPCTKSVALQLATTERNELIERAFTVIDNDQDTSAATSEPPQTPPPAVALNDEGNVMLGRRRAERTRRSQWQRRQLSRFLAVTTGTATASPEQADAPEQRSLIEAFMEAEMPNEHEDDPDPDSVLSRTILEHFGH